MKRSWTFLDVVMLQYTVQDVTWAWENNTFMHCVSGVLLTYMYLSVSITRLELRSRFVVITKFQLNFLVELVITICKAGNVLRAPTCTTWPLHIDLGVKCFHNRVERHVLSSRNDCNYDMAWTQHLSTKYTSFFTVVLIGFSKVFCAFQKFT